MIDAQSPEVRDRLTAALGIGRWVDEVAAGGPYSSAADLAAAVDRTGADLTGAELDEALASSATSRSRPPAGEQAGLARNDEGDDAALARGAEVYARRFGRPFLISRAGRSRQQLLDELQRRLKNDDDAEAAEAKQQLREIAGTRVRTLFGDDA